MDESAYTTIESALFFYFQDPAVDELLVNGGRGLWLIQSSGTNAATSPFASSTQVATWAQELARRNGIRLDPLCGAAGGSLADHGFRWHCVLPPLSPDGALLSIRRHRFAAIELKDFSGSAEALLALAAAMQGRSNLLIAGPTGSGKTTLLAALLRTYAKAERVILVESLAELPVPSAASVRLLERRPNLEQVGAVPLTRLVQEALRLRPDRLVIGEVRGSEAAALCEALMSGHEGVLATLHASDPEDAVARLSFLASAAGWGKAPLGWQGLPLVVAMLARGARLLSVTSHRFVPSG